MVRLLCQQAIPTPVKGGSHAGKKITAATLSHGPPEYGPHGGKKKLDSLIAAIIFALVHLEAKHTLSSLSSQQKREKELSISNCITKNAC